MTKGGSVTKIDDAPNLGPCCGCGLEGPAVRNILMLQKKSPLAGKGWGCFTCGLPSDGATAVVCDGCLHSKAPLVTACRGCPGADGRVPIGELGGSHHHDLAAHIRAGEEIPIACPHCGASHLLEASRDKTLLLAYHCPRLTFVDIRMIEGHLVAGMPIGEDGKLKDPPIRVSDVEGER